MEISHTRHTMSWSSRSTKYSLTQGFRWTSRSRRCQLHMQRNKVILCVIGRGVRKPALWLFWGGTTTNPNLTLWGTKKDNLVEKFACFLSRIQTPSFLHSAYLQVHPTANAVHKYLFLYPCFEPGFSYWWSKGECQRADHTEILWALSSQTSEA